MYLFKDGFHFRGTPGIDGEGGVGSLIANMNLTNSIDAESLAKAINVASARANKAGSKIHFQVFDAMA